MTAAILCTGTELTRGELVNTNATWLAEALTRAGFEVTAIDCTDDSGLRIEQALTRLSAEHEVIVSTGGLGPTTDDITAESAARAAGVTLKRHPEAERQLRERLARFGREASASNLKQTDLPEGSILLPNPRGTAPGFALQLKAAQLFCLPGVPSEMKGMFEEQVLPKIQHLRSGGQHQIILRTFGLAEADVNDKLAGIEAAHAVIIGYRAGLLDLEVKVLARAESDAAARVRAQAASAEVESRLGSKYVFGYGKSSLAEALGELARTRQLKLVVAESCTGGLIAELLTQSAGASSYFRGGVVVYDNALKRDLLGVSDELLAAHGAVSENTARAMAEGARQRLQADLAIAVTGIAGPAGGTPEKPVGLVFMACANASGTSVQKRLIPGDREAVRRRAASFALSLAREVVLFGHL